MSNTVHKKAGELALWEEVSAQGPRQVKLRQAEAKQSPPRKARRPEQIRTIQTIPIEESTERPNAVRTAKPRQSRAPQGREQRNRPSQSRPPQSRSSQNRPRPISAQTAERRKARRRRAYIYRIQAFMMVILCIILAAILAGFVYGFVQEWKEQKAIPVTGPSDVDEEGKTEKTEKSGIEAPKIITDFLEVNDYSRPGTELEKIESIFVHYTANPGTSAAQNRSYFANLALTQERSASAHFIIGYEGEIIQCIPLDEEAYAVMSRNEDSISIECCYLDEDGKFTQETYDSLIHLLAWLMQEYHLDSSDILRHYDCGGKRCPLYYVDHEDAWERLLEDVAAYERRY